MKWHRTREMLEKSLIGKEHLVNWTVQQLTPGNDNIQVKSSSQQYKAAIKDAFNHQFRKHAFQSMTRRNIEVNTSKSKVKEQEKY